MTFTDFLLPLIQAEALELLEWSRLCQHLATFAATKLGETAARQLAIPSDRATSERLLSQTQETYSLEAKLPGGLNFDGIQDIGEYLERAELRGILQGKELLAIATTLYGARQLRRTIDAQEDCPVLKELVEELRTYPEIEQAIHHCIDDRGDVTDRASPKLEAIRRKLKDCRDRIYDSLNKILNRNSNAIQEFLITQRSDRFVIPVKATHKDAIPGIVHDSSTSGATLYVEPNAIVQQGNQLRQLVRQEQTEEETIRRQLTEQVAEVQPDLERLLAIATLLDLAVARARYSLWLEGNPPRFIDESASPLSASPLVVLRQLRHPLLIWQQKHENGRSVVPIDLVVQPQTRVVAITGPNTGGKTVTLKTLGMAALMAKVGLFVPAREPVELPWFSQILVDIGDEQSLQQSLSTFSGHIRRIGRILEALGGEELEEGGEEGEDSKFKIQNSKFKIQDLALVLLDEVGAGTDPSEGSALAIALLQYLADHARLTVATTHFGELKALKYQDERFENASVEFDDLSMSPTYRLLWGIPGRSNALAIARRLGLNPAVVERAQTFVGGASEDVNQVIAGLEAQRRQQEEKAIAAAQLVQQAERLNQEISRKAALLKEREQTLQLQQEQAVQAAIAQAKGEIAGVIRRLQKGTATAQDAQQATADLGQIAERRLPSKAAPAKPKPGFMPKVGDRIRLTNFGQTAEVLTEPNKDGKLEVRFGMMKMTVSLADIESLQGEKPTPPPKPAPSTPPPAPAPSPPPATAPLLRTSRNTLDIRGKRVDDAEVDLEAAIAKANAGPLWIIHGHGTGKLKNGVHDFLKRHPQVDRFELAEQKDGGAGVTIAYIR